MTNEHRFRDLEDYQLSLFTPHVQSPPRSIFLNVFCVFHDIIILKGEKKIAHA